MNQKVAAKMLDRLGYKCHVTANGVEALEALRKDKYDLVLMDLQVLARILTRFYGYRNFALCQ